MHVRHAAWLLLILLVAAPVEANDEETWGRIQALDGEDETAREDAHAWWDALGVRKQVPILRGLLASDDEDRARIAALALGPEFLSEDELHRMVRLRLANPLDTLGGGLDWALDDRIAIGSRELADFFRAAAKDRDGEEAVGYAGFTRIHRVVRPQNLPTLLAFLQHPDRDVFAGALFNVENLGQHDRSSRFREPIAAGLLYGLRRLRAERAGTKPPRMEDVAGDLLPKDGGLAPGLVEMARACDPDGTNGFRVSEKSDEPLSQDPPWRFTARWLLDSTPAPHDVPFLHDAVRIGIDSGKASPFTRAVVLWAMRYLVGVPGPAGRGRIESWARGTEGADRAWMAAAALALADAPAPFEALRERDAETDEPTDSLLEPLLWFVDRPRAIEHTITRLLPEEGAPHAHHWLAPPERLWRRFYWGIDVTPQDLDAINRGLWERSRVGDVDATRTLVRWHAWAHPAGLDSARAEALLKRLPALLEATATVDAWASEDLESYRRLVSLLEVRDRTGTIALLRDWAATKHPERAFAIGALLRLGAEVAPADAISVWDDVETYAFVGLQRSGEVTAFLEARAPDAAFEPAEDALYEAVCALHAFLLRDGIPPGIEPLFEALRMGAETGGSSFRDALRDAWTLRAEGEPVAALLALAEMAEHGIHAVGLVDHPSARVWLAKRQRERHHAQYWEATAGLARTNAAAADEMRALVRAGRTWVLDGNQRGGIQLGPREPMIQLLTEGLDTNCCLGWSCHVLLQEIHPWIPFDPGFGGVGMENTRAYLAAHAWRHSEIFGGPVPAPR